MPTRKQRRRAAKDKRHDYEFVYVDGDGNELDEPPDELLPEPKGRSGASRNGAKPATKKAAPPARGGRRTPQPPSWQRATKRAALLGVFVFIIFGFSASRSHHNLLVAVIPAVIYTALFVPFTYMIDRFAYRRYLARQQAGAAPARTAKKR